MKILHTADWHLGQHLYTRKRYDEFEKFLHWLVEKIRDEFFEVLLIAGDIFDTSTPSNRAQELYNNFLADASNTQCRHIVITGGNHDSPSLLNAQRNVFKLLQIHVVGSAEANPKDEVLLLKDAANKPELIVCAVPYLRDRDVRKAEAGETIEEKGKKLIEGIRTHYAEVCSEAEKLQASLERWVPIVAMGHLFTAGGKITDGDGVRDLYIGSLAHVHADLFPPCIDYLALGHLHAPQIVNGKPTMRYSGSPLPIGFAEAEQQKEVICVEFQERQIKVEGHKIPTFQPLRKIRGDWEYIFSELQKEKELQQSTFLEIVYTGSEIIDHHFREQLERVVEGTSIEILKINNERKRNRILIAGENSASLDDLKPIDVFKSLLEAEQIPENDHQDLVSYFQMILHDIHEPLFQI